MSNQDAIEAAVFRRLVDHLRMRTDVQNIDLMGVGGFCRNCLSDWYQEAAEAAGAPVDKETARERIYGMSYADYKAKYQTPATDAQLKLMDESVAKNKALRGEG
ncbi:DUF1244 domain-containing protein [Kordiimonas marina]|uniref:DUF1244 domain-containing protein n=1 Tax=Kordiimonas marina TaxID=2872312 RepID=UPI001FF5DECE|nr:DUF1244 domain-containing protein [Kordiimonas marina]MCJ9427992.1 DUF1244 domain-containing protein [Kordiimonas marina]